MSATPTDKQKCGALALANYMTQYNSYATASQYGWETLTKTNKGLTEAYKNLFVSTADSYQFSYITTKQIPNVLSIEPTATYTQAQFDQVRGKLALQYLIKQYPSYNFVKKTDEDYVLR